MSVPIQDAVPPLVEPDDLSEFRGAPFPQVHVAAAAEQVRSVCGWHIAPSITQTVDLDHDGSGVLHLRSLYVTDVSSVEDVTGPTPRALTGWRWSQDGMIEGRSLPRGFRSVRVTFTHGYDLCPPDLLPIIASRTQRRVMQESLGSRSVSYSAEGDRALEDSLSGYMLGPRA